MATKKTGEGTTKTLTPVKRGAAAKRSTTKGSTAKRATAKRAPTAKRASTAKQAPKTKRAATAKDSTAKRAATAKRSTAKRAAPKPVTSKRAPAKRGKASTGAQEKGAYTKPELRERLKRKIMAGDKGGRAGQWSARKAQLLAHAYEEAGGGYRGGRSASQRHLDSWTKEEWTTADGKPARRGKTMARYLPKKAWKELSPGEREATEKKKRAGSRGGRQFVANTGAAAEARRHAAVGGEGGRSKGGKGKRAPAKRATAKRPAVKRKSASRE